MWGEKCAMVLCSTGAEDRMDDSGSNSAAITTAMPVAMVLKEESKLHTHDNSLKMTKTLCRIKEHLECDYGLKRDNAGEIWTIKDGGKKVSIEGYQILEEQKHFLDRAKEAKMNHNALSALRRNLESLEKSGVNPCEMSIDEIGELISRLDKAAEKITSDV